MKSFNFILLLALLIYNLNISEAVIISSDESFDKISADFILKGISSDFIYNITTSNLMPFYTKTTEMILLNPPLENPIIFEALTFVINTLEPVYSILLILLGFYLIFISGSLRGRAKAKILFPKLILSMFFVTLSPYILRFLFYASYNLSEDILKFNSSEESIFLETFKYLTRLYVTRSVIETGGGVIFLLSAFFLTMMILIVLSLRFILATLFAIFFPLAIFFYFFDFSKNIGRFMIEQTIIWTFAQSIFSLVYVISNLIATLMNFEGHLRVISGITAMLILVISPLVLISLRKLLP